MQITEVLWNSLPKNTAEKMLLKFVILDYCRLLKNMNIKINNNKKPTPTPTQTHKLRQIIQIIKL